MAKEQGIAKAIRCTKAAIEMLDRAADSLNVDDSLRKRIVAKRQDVEDLLDELNPDIPSSITDPKDDGSCDPLRGRRMDSADVEHPSDGIGGCTGGWR